MRRGTLALALLALLGALAHAESDGELRNAKALYLDRQYAEARKLFQAVRGSGSTSEASQAQYWIARCSESLGENERALGEYGEFLSGRPKDRTLVEEARTSRISVAVKLARSGSSQHLGIARDALADASRTVRYFAALQLAALGPQQGRIAVPVLKEILAKETDADLVDRAKLYLIHLDPKALPREAEEPRRAGSLRTWIRVRIYGPGARKPQLSINLPVALAEMMFDGLPSETRKDLQHQGYDAAKFWKRLKETGPTDILTVEGEDGGRIQVWIE